MVHNPLSLSTQRESFSSVAAVAGYRHPHEVLASSRSSTTSSASSGSNTTAGSGSRTSGSSNRVDVDGTELENELSFIRFGHDLRLKEVKDQYR